MSHPRTTIRNYLVALLTDPEAPLGTVLKQQVHPHTVGQLPSIEVRTPTDRVVGKHSDAPLILHRNLDVEITVRTRGASAEDSANTIADAIEQLILAEDSLGGNCNSCLLESTSVSMAAGEKPVAEAVLSFTAEYYTEHATEIDEEFALAVADWDLGTDPDGHAEASDDLTLPQ